MLKSRTNKKKGIGIIIFLVVFILLAAVILWKKSFFLKLLPKKNEDSNVVVNTITKYITTKAKDFPIKKGSTGKLVEQVQQFYNTAPSQVIKNRTPLIVDGKWGESMDKAFKKSGLPLVITKEIFDTVFQLK